MSTHAESPTHVRWLGNRPELRNPILITAFEGWNDAGDAASIAAAHLADRWDGTPLAEIDAEFFYDFSTTRPLVQLDDDRQRSITWPTNQFRACRVPGAARDAVVLIGLEPQLRWRTFCDQIVETARELGVSQIVTLGAARRRAPQPARRALRVDRRRAADGRARAGAVDLRGPHRDRRGVGHAVP
ncbi:MAG: PAC2 family protein [Acidimicrobiales bacterium]